MIFRHQGQETEMEGRQDMIGYDVGSRFTPDEVSIGLFGDDDRQFAQLPEGWDSLHVFASAIPENDKGNFDDTANADVAMVGSGQVGGMFGIGEEMESPAHNARWPDDTSLHVPKNSKRFSAIEQFPIGDKRADSGASFADNEGIPIHENYDSLVTDSILGTAGDNENRLPSFTAPFSTMVANTDHDSALGNLRFPGSDMLNESINLQDYDDGDETGGTIQSIERFGVSDRQKKADGDRLEDFDRPLGTRERGEKIRKTDGAVDESMYALDDLASYGSNPSSRLGTARDIAEDIGQAAATRFSHEKERLAELDFLHDEFMPLFSEKSSQATVGLDRRFTQDDNQRDLGDDIWSVARNQKSGLETSRGLPDKIYPDLYAQTIFATGLDGILSTGGTTSSEVKEKLAGLWDLSGNIERILPKIGSAQRFGERRTEKKGEAPSTIAFRRLAALRSDNLGNDIDREFARNEPEQINIAGARTGPTGHKNDPIYMIAINSVNGTSMPMVPTSGSSTRSPPIPGQRNLA